MLYSGTERFICNASSCAQGILSRKIPFPLMHVDTQWKFKVYKFRSLMAKQYNVDIKVWINPDGKDVVNPFTHGSETYSNNEN